MKPVQLFRMLISAEIDGFYAPRETIHYELKIFPRYLSLIIQSTYIYYILIRSLLNIVDRSIKYLDKRGGYGV